MELFLLSWFVAMWVVRAAQNIVYAIQGKPPVQVQKASARAVLRGEEPRIDPAEKRYGFKDYVKDLGHEAAVSAREKHELGMERRREKREFKEQQRLGKQRAKQARKLGATVTEPDDPSETPDTPDAPTSTPEERAPNSLDVDDPDYERKVNAYYEWKAGAPKLPADLCGKPTGEYTDRDWVNYYRHKADRHRYLAEAAPNQDERYQNQALFLKYEDQYQVAAKRLRDLDDDRSPAPSESRPPLSLGDDDPSPRMATVTPIRTTNTEGNQSMSDTTEITGLQSGIQHCEQMSEYFGQVAATREADEGHLQDMATQLNECWTSSESSQQALTAGGVSGAPITALASAAEMAGQAAQRYESAAAAMAHATEAVTQAQAAYAQAKAELEKQNAVAEQYAANPDAGDKEFVTAE